MNKLGIQWQIEDQSIIDYNTLVYPWVLKGINSRTRPFWEKLRAENPDGVRIYRHYPNFPWAEDPEQQAQNAIGELRQFIGIPENDNEYLMDTITHVEDNNEFVHAHQADLWPAADLYMSTFMRLARERLGLGTVFLNAATGNFSADIVNAFPISIETALELNAEGGPEIFLGFHEYDAPTMDRIHQEDIAKGGEGYWHCGRWKRAAGAIKAVFGATPRFIITECGIDFGVLAQHGKGFRSIWPGDLAASVESYVGDRSLRWYKRLLDEDGDVFGAAIFIESGEGDWADFDIRGTEIPRFIAQMPDWTPEEPNGGNEMDIAVRDMRGNWHDFAWAKQKYGVAYQRAQVSPGQKVWRLIEMWEKPNSSSLITQTLDENGDPLPGVAVTFFWPDAPNPPDPPTTVYSHDWYNWFTWGYTKGDDADIGPGMGGGAAHGEGEGGPHAVWVHDADVPSDIAEKLGWLAYTNHDHLDLKFQLMTAGEDGNGNGNGGDMQFVLDYREEDYHPLGAVYILWPAGDSYDTNARGGVVGGMELNVSNPIKVARDGREYAQSELSAAGTWEGVRTYWIQIHKMDSALTPLCAQQMANFVQGEQKAVYFVMRKSEEPEPTPDGWAEEIRAIGETMEQNGVRLQQIAAYGEPGSIVKIRVEYGDGSQETFVRQQGFLSRIAALIKK